MKIQILHPEGRQIVNENASIKILASGFKFSEGPLWHPEGYVLFSDIPANKIFQVYMNGVMHVALHQSGGPCITYTHLSDMIGSNGIALDNEKNLVFCQHGNHGIAKLDKGKNLIQLCSSYNGKAFNSPNDLAISSAGAVFFTDPPYGLKGQVLNPAYFQPHSGIYKFHNNQVVLLSTDLNYPNGICFSKDEKHVFVSSNHPDEKMILKYTLDENFMLTEKTVFAEVNADGIKMDQYNNLFAATNEGVMILSETGEKLALIKLPQMVTNLAIGGVKNDMLFITTPSTIYNLQLSYQQQQKTAAEEKNDKLLKKIPVPAAVAN